MTKNEELSRGKLFILNVAIGLGTFIQVLDTSIANVAIPYIAGNLSVSADQGTWVITSFSASNAIVLPLTGWLMTSAAGYTVSFFGLFIIPAPISANEQAKALFGTLHEGFAYALIVAIIIHILAALKHHFIDKDDILRRML